MLNICKTVSTLNESGANIITTTTVSELISVMNEGFVGSVVDNIKAFFQKLKELLYKVYHAIFGNTGSSSRSSRGSSSQSGNSGWTSQQSSAVRRKLSNDYFIRNFRWELHNWDNQYLDTMSEKIEKLDDIRLKLPGGYMINSSASAIVREITKCIRDYKSSGRSPKNPETLLEYFRNDIRHALERIYYIPDGESYQALIPKKIHSDLIFTKPLSYNEISNMVEAVENEANVTAEIERTYRSLMDDINAADREIQGLSTDDYTPELELMVNTLAQALQYKVSVITSLEHIHIRAIRERSAEYSRELLRFVNM